MSTDMTEGKKRIQQDQNFIWILRIYIITKLTCQAMTFSPAVIKYNKQLF